VDPESLKVGYSYANGSANTIRPTGIDYPHVEEEPATTTIIIDYALPMADALSRPDQIEQGSSVLSSTRYAGLSMLVERKYDAAADTVLSYGTPTDGYAGYDRFGWIAATLWKVGSTSLVHSQYT